MLYTWRKPKTLSSIRAASRALSDTLKKSLRCLLPMFWRRGMAAKGKHTEANTAAICSH